MPKAKYQLVTSLTLKSEVNVIIAEVSTTERPIDKDDIDFFLRIESETIGTDTFFFLKGFFEIRRTGNLRNNLIKESNAVSPTTSVFDFEFPISRGIFFIKHDVFVELFTGTDNLLLEPKILRPLQIPLQGYLKILYYRHSFQNPAEDLSGLTENSSILASGKDLFPSPPATGTNQ